MTERRSKEEEDVEVDAWSSDRIGVMDKASSINLFHKLE